MACHARFTKSPSEAEIMTLIPITPHFSLDTNEIEEDFVRSSGAGGQNVKIFATVNAQKQTEFRIEVGEGIPGL
jgi:protein subunit release factor B